MLERLAWTLPVLLMAVGCNDKGSTTNDLAMVSPVDASMITPEQDLATVVADLAIPDSAAPPDLAIQIIPADLAMNAPANDDGGQDVAALQFQTAGPISLAVDGTGAPVIAGGLINSSRFGSITLAAQASPGSPVTLSDVFAVKFASDGTSVWGNRYGDAADQLASAVTVNGSGVVLVAGLFSGMLSFSSTMALNSANDTNFLAAFDGATGKPLWVQELDLGPGGFVLGLATDPTDQGFVIAATATAAVPFGSFSGMAGGGKDLFVAKLKATGELVWARQIGGTGDQIARAVAVDGAGNAFVAGQFAGVLDFGAGALPKPPTGAKNVYVAKLDSMGMPIATIAIGNRGNQLAEAIAVDKAGDVVIGGYLAGSSVMFDVGIVLAPHGQDGFVAKLGGDLKHTLWARRIGEHDVVDADAGAPSLDPQEVTAVAIDSVGNVAAVGLFQGAVDFQTGAPVHAISSDAFALKLDGVSGANVWMKSTGGSGDEKATAVGMSALDGSVWIAGTFTAAIATPPLPNWGSSPSTELGFPMDDGSQSHTFLVQLGP
jgi:hypothetical protein